MALFVSILRNVKTDLRVEYTYTNQPTTMKAVSLNISIGLERRYII